jgi:hypothetical protein
VESAGDDVKVACHARVFEATRILDVLVMQRIEGADADPRGR